MESAVNNRATDTHGPQAVAKADAPDPGLLTRAIIDLNIAHRSVAMYPAGHARIREGVEAAFRGLGTILSARSELTLGVMNDTILVNAEPLDEKNPTLRDYAHALREREILTLTFFPGLQSEELLRFNSLLAMKPDAIRKAGGWDKLSAREDITHIRAREMDYGRLSLTEEAEIHTTPKIKGNKTDTNMWYAFVRHMAHPDAPGASGQLTPVRLADVDPEQFARFLNEHKIDVRKALESYDSILSLCGESGAEGDAQVTSTASTAEMNKWLNELDPLLRNQFMSLALDHLTATDSVSQAKQLLSAFDNRQVIDILQQASDEHREVSPALLRLMQSMAHSDDSGSKDEGSRKPDAGLTSEHVSNLLQRETYESFVEDEYDARLRELITSQADASPATGSNPAMAEYLVELQDDQLDIRIARMLMAFTNEVIGEDDYAKFAKKLKALLPVLVETGQFHLLHNGLNQFCAHSEAATEPWKRESASNVLEAYRDPSLLEAILEAAGEESHHGGTELYEILGKVGPEVAPILVRAWARQVDGEGDERVFRILLKYPAQSAREAVARIEGSQSPDICRLLVLLRSLQDAEMTPALEPLLTHHDETVTTAAMETLLALRSPAAVSRLKELLLSPDRESVLKGAVLAGRYQISEITDSLTRNLGKVAFSKRACKLNTALVEALGNIGAPDAIPALRQLAQSKWSLYQQDLKKMKVSLFMSLEHYPAESTVDLLRMGSRFADAAVRRHCAKLLARSGGVR